MVTIPQPLANPAAHVVIVGGGAAACAAALFLRAAQPTIRITLVEKQAAGAISSGGQRIGETLPAASAVFLQRLGLWQSFLRCGFLPTHGTAAAWGSAELYHNESITSPYGGGWHLDRAAFDQWLLKTAMDRDIHYLSHCQLRHSQFNNTTQQWTCSLVEGPGRQTPLTCDFIIDATGRGAHFARGQGAQRIAADRLVGVYGIFAGHPERSREGGYTLVESQPQGWWYSAKLPDNRWVVALMSDATTIKHNRLKTYGQWYHLLRQTQHTWPRLDGVVPAANTGEAKLTLVAAHSQYLDHCVGPGWLACGDAASSYDPLSSLGLFKAFRTGLYSAYAVTDFLTATTAPQRALGLRKYQHLVAREYQAYQQTKAAYYAQEQRFSTPFWHQQNGHFSASETMASAQPQHPSRTTRMATITL